MILLLRADKSSRNRVTSGKIGLDLAKIHLALSR